MKKELITSKKAFTLIELIAILVILSIVILITLPALQKTNKNSKTNEKATYIQTFEIAIDTYLQMNKERFADFTNPGQMVLIGIPNLINAGLISTNTKNPDKETNPDGDYEKDQINYIGVNIDEETLEYEYAYFTGEEVQDYITETPESIEELTNRLEAIEQNTSGSIETLTNRLEAIEQNTSLIVLLNKIYPIGSVYISSSSTNPGSYLTGTTWEAYGQGRTIIGVGNNGATTYSAGGTGGSETHNHGGKVGNTKLTVAQIPSHNHGMYSGYGDGSAGIDAYRFQYWASSELKWRTDTPYGTASTGGGGSHTHTISSNSNVQPYIVSYIWRRTA